MSARSRVRWPRAFLIGLGILAFLVPVLPLAAPARPELERKLKEPSLWPLMESGFSEDQLVNPGPLTAQMAALRSSVFGDLRVAPVLGTDDLGRCVLSRILWGARLSLLVGLVASLLSLIIGVAWGAIAGYFGGLLDAVMMRSVDILYSLPLMFIVIFVVTFLRGLKQANTELPIDQVIILFAVIGGVSWLVMARLVRSQVLSLTKTPFIDAARTSGSTAAKILWRHVLPNVTPLVLVTLTLTVPRVMLLEAYLSFLGLGVEAPDVSWGLLARQGFDAVTAVHLSWWLIVFPGLAIGATLYAMNVLGDGLRDSLDPLLKRRLGDNG